MKYSFADLRDIIKGTDLWDQNNDAKRLQENFKIIYGKIKGTLGAKYARDDPPYTNLRQNWWEAMKCRIPELRAVPDKQVLLILWEIQNISETKRNELFGTNHTKNTTFNSFSKQSHSDPIMNQLNLFHKWLDRHRYICEKWKHKEDMLNKLNEE
ncbi:hypothetical protein PFBG_00502 [Plasmodium falciparum 7G8]|uniref:Uncharacterized protein n=1 Tax=Plasmodium falciparum (isolate 7G8) TaxID=57266 RepID=W7FDY8_PLAF8|nr:hypothetical protein PFBG_00502 [Plasmodium falciparum 7G8]